ncbi:HAMP domain-containing sensor histidine kinase [Streptomyces sp. NPDC013172]|uniref:sensor histidine kinase n=1 Tax=Streptomyces sp. NPDC013172 TaxID=3155009 RepID=UPI0033DEA1A4
MDEAGPPAFAVRLRGVLRARLVRSRRLDPRISVVPLRRSLLMRLLAASALVSVCSVIVTAWVVSQTTAVALGGEQGQALADEAHVYDSLVGYAATHTSWSEVQSTVERLGRQAGHRVVLTAEDGRVLADSAPERGHVFQPPPKATAVVNPLSVSAQLATAPGADGVQVPGTAGSAASVIDSRVVGPFELSAQETRRLRVLADRVARCVHVVAGVQARVQLLPSGRPRVIVPGADDYGSIVTGPCAGSILNKPVASEAKPLENLNSLVNSCLRHLSTGTVTLEITGGWTPHGTPAPSDDAVSSCLATSRAQQLAPYVAPGALLYVDSNSRTAKTFFDLSAANRLRIAGWGAVVLVVTVIVTSLAGVRLARPLRRLTVAATRMEDGDLTARVPVRGRDEVARLAAAFNAMSERREKLEILRRDMTNDIAHELRTPVSNLRGWLEAVEDGLARPDADFVTSLLGQALQLQHIIDDLRDLSAAEAGELRLSRAPVRVAELLLSVVTAGRAAAAPAGVSLRSEADPTIMVLADPVRLRQMVDNLVSNAIRHTPAGGTVTLRADVEHHDGSDHHDTGRQRHEGRTVVIDVSDTGCGIEPAELPHIFDRFWRVEKSRNRRSGGSGLGLAIVRRLAEAHGGSVTVTSTVGSGSTFTLNLPW